MEKVFKRYLLIVLFVTMVILLLFNYIFISKNLTDARKNLSSEKLEQLVSILEENQIEFDALTMSLNEGYLASARAFAYMIEKNPLILENSSELRKITELLDVDEVHVSDIHGVIQYSSVPRYRGMDFHAGEQMQEFLPILYGEEEYVIQEVKPNTAEGRLMQYVGVTRLDKRGIVQVGIEPKRILEAISRNQYSYIFGRIPTDIGEHIFAVDCKNNVFTGHTSEDIEAGSSLSDYDQDIVTLLECQYGGFVYFEGEKRYVMTKEYNDVLLGISVSSKELYASRMKDLFLVLCSLIFVGIVVSFVLKKILYKTVIKGIHQIIDDLHVIQRGNLGKVIEVGGNPEIESLSNSINTMVKGILSTMMRLSKVIEITEIPMASFECRKNMDTVSVTNQLKGLLHLKDEEEIIFESQTLFFRKINEIKKCLVDDEKDIYRINENSFIKLIIVEEHDTIVGSVVDVSEEYLKRRSLRYAQGHDPLTKLKNYIAFKECVEDILEKKEHPILASVMIDLDNFKDINDTYGHNFGDQYLTAFAQVLRELPDDHCIYARRSGDEFCIFIYGYESKDKVIKLLEQLWEKIDRVKINIPNEDKEKTYEESVKLRASGGLAWVDGTDFDTIMNDADEMLYIAKQDQKGIYMVQYEVED